MSKSTYFTGQPVYSQVIKLLDKVNINLRSLSRQLYFGERLMTIGEGRFQPEFFVADVR